MNYRNREKDGGMAFISGDAPRFNGNTFTVSAAPGVQAMKLPEPLPLMGHPAKYVDVKYEGEMNHADNTVTVAAMDQLGPEWRKFDMMRMKARINYLGLGMDRDDRNYAYNVQFRITQQDAISAAYATQLTELEFMAMLIQSTIPAMKGFNAGEKKYTGSGQFAYLIWYQTMLQNLAIVMGKYNTLMTYADYLIQMGYNAESHLTTRIINILKKQNVWTLFDQLGNLLKSEFFDLTFYNEITGLNTIPCRKEDSVSEPMIIMSSTVRMPDIMVFPSGTNKAGDEGAWDFNSLPDESTDLDTRKAFIAAVDALISANEYPTLMTYRPPKKSVQDTMVRRSWEEYLYDITLFPLPANPPATLRDDRKAYGKVLDDLSTNYSDVKLIDGRTGAETSTVFGTTEDLFSDIIGRLDMFKLVEWARGQYFTNPSDSAAAAADLAVSYVNALIDRLVTLVNVVTHYRADTSDLVTFLRVLQSSTALNTWVLDVPYLHPKLPRAQAKPVYFKLIYDIINSYGTSGTMVKDETTRDWKIFTWWHQDEGIPKYDAYNGGFTIACSVRGVPANPTIEANPNLQYSTPEYMVPVLFKVQEILTMNRRGLVVPITKETLNEATNHEISQDSVLAAANLMALPDTISVPKIDFHAVTFPSEKGVAATTEAKKQTEAQAIRMLSKFFGVGRIITSTNVAYNFLDPLMEGLIGREFANCTTMALDYINGRAPFRTTGSNGGLGFKV